MTPKKLLLISKLLIVIGVLTLLAWISFPRSQKDYKSDIDSFLDSYKKTQEVHSLQKSPRSQESHNLKSSFLALNPLQITYKIPDLRTVLLYHGDNKRPDSLSETSKILFSIRGNSIVYSAAPYEKIGLSFQGKSHLNTLSSSSPPSSAKWRIIEEEKSVLTLFFTQESPNRVIAHIEYISPQGQNVEIDSPQELKEFTISLSPPPAIQAESQKWRIEGIPVDPTLLEKQKAAWFGKDLLFETLDSDEWSGKKDHERIQFGMGENSYTIWAKPKDSFIFENNGWIFKPLGEGTRGKNLLILEKRDLKYLFFTLWSDDGSHHIPIQLTKKEISSPHTAFSAHQRKESSPYDIKIVGTKTHNTWITEIQGARYIIRAFDWILFPTLSQKPIIIDSIELLEEYIEGKREGWLIAFQGTKKIENDLCLTGFLFNPHRSHVSPLHISLYRSWKKEPQKSLKTDLHLKKDHSQQNQKREHDDDDDDDDDFDEDDLLEDDFDDE